jgi:L-fuculose-phosphate aldolase
MSASEAQLRAEIVEVGRRLYARGYTASNDGNISVRLDAGRLLMTPKSVCKGFMTPDMMVVVSSDGKIFHASGCPFIHDKAHVRTIVAREALKEGYVPCVRCMKKYLQADLVSPHSLHDRRA